ncbi:MULTISPECIES: hypothetical protein [unclassified Simplicispira]|uniref:hypothetical protein n=1 Tax=unclassified Simplicispira TaxID=2630407 RepID=UPI001057E47B|nr:MULTISPECIES: hypothetical protein [unclassified Simplicispira]
MILIATSALLATAGVIFSLEPQPFENKAASFVPRGKGRQAIAHHMTKRRQKLATSRSSDLHTQFSVTRAQCEKLHDHAGRAIWVTGLFEVAKSTWAPALEIAQHTQVRRSYAEQYF